MSKILSYKDLIVWQKGMTLAEQVYLITAGYPKSELYSLTDQMRRAAVSIVSNIAEGKGRESKQEYLHFLAISQGSLTELETQILLSIRLRYLSEIDAETPLSLCDEIGRMLNTMRTKLKAASQLTPNP
ncbi:MAG: four helix bundle protein [Candidatus Cloacimonetes bacterium]|jgi:four helix bundle protein|nr:four helix bundle protein [Candidatus Cloacimonadota bacterium]